MVLANKGYEPYLPLHSTRRQRSDRVVEIDLPLFPGYLFCRFDPLRRRLPVITTPGVCGIVGLGNTPEAIPDEEIFAIQKMLRSGPSAEPWPYLRDGERVTVIRGSLTGLEGVLVRKKGQCRLVVSVSLLQRSVSVEIDQDSISPLR
jgi:transcription antitermination factor NusG